MTNNLLIKQVRLNGQTKDIFIEGNKFSAIADHLEIDTDKIIDGRNMAIIPPFYNGHTHAVMTLLRGYADDMELFKWLNEYIWPMEAKLTLEDYYIGSKLAALEMIKSGTVFFFDMYFHLEETIRAIEEMGIRANLSYSILESQNPEDNNAKFKEIDSLLNMTTSRISCSIAPHAIYTVGKDLYRQCANYAREHDIFLHTHCAETQKEFDDCMSQHHCTPIELLNSLGVLSPKTVLAHGVYLTDNDINIIKETGAIIVHNPCSNLKLSSGLFRFQPLIDAGCKVAIGTDGCSSNNNLDMLEEMKFASLLAKVQYGSESAPSQLIFDLATKNAAEAFNINGGEIKEGKLADALLINLNHVRMVPNFNLNSNMVYATNSECIDTMICDGKIIMQGRNVLGESEIIESAKKAAFNLKKRNN